jgi:hypothetical protein
MADNPPDASKSGSLPPLPSSGMTGRLKSPTTHLPVKKGGAGKIVVMLSSVAKPAPAGTQVLPKIPAPSNIPAKTTPAGPAKAASQPPPLPPKQVVPANRPLPGTKLTATTYVKLPPKTSVPQLSTLSGLPITAPVPMARELPEIKAPQPALPKKSAQHIPPIKLNESSAVADFSGESIFATDDQVKSTISTLPAESLPKPAPAAPLPEAKEKSAPLIAPPLLPPQRLGTTSKTVAAPPSLPPPVPKSPEPKPAEATSANPVHVAPPMLEKAPEPPSEKLPQPHIGTEARKSEPSPALPESPGVHKVPALIQPESPSSGPAQMIPPSKPLLPAASSVAKATGNWLTKSIPLVLSSTSKLKTPDVAEVKPALRPPTLPKRALPNPDDAVVEPPKPPVEPVTAPAVVTKEKPEVSSAIQPPAVVTPVVTPAEVAPITSPPAPEASTPSSVAKEKPEAKAAPSQTPPVIPIVTKAKEPVPLTRAARAAKRHFWETVVFYVFFATTMFMLFMGGLHFGRDTRVEGQVIPPAGMKLNNEVWIVTDFSPLAAGIADDLAKERTPLMQEIQERQDHLQRAQADVASREERIRLTQEQINAAKDEINTAVKQSRDATQQVWDIEGAKVDDEYASRLSQLQKAIADRAKSLNLKYQPDNTYQSPEVWANAYRLALYQVPAGVDSVKEHQWLGDQMKQWRDFQKTLDDRKEQLREKAAQLKLAPAPKISDLNAKIEDLQQRIDGTTAEEVPLKAELQQAQVDLAAAQASVAGLDDKYYKQLNSLPQENITKHIPLAGNGRFTWVEDDSFAEGEKERHYWIFSRATRADGRQYWALHHFSIALNQTVELIIEPAGFVSTKAILRPDLTREEQEQ